MKRAFSPSLNPAGLTSAGMAIYAAAVMLWNASHHYGVIDPAVIVAAIGAVAALLTRQVVTPVADPRDGNGTPLLKPKTTAAGLSYGTGGNVTVTTTPPVPTFTPGGQGNVTLKPPDGLT